MSHTAASMAWEGMRFVKIWLTLWLIAWPTSQGMEITIGKIVMCVCLYLCLSVRVYVHMRALLCTCACVCVVVGRV